jgi:hypothetical protein
MKTLNVTQVKVIFNEKVEKPIVVFVTAEGIDIARTPKQALLDLQNSGRGLDLSPNTFDRGLANVSNQQIGAFKKALFGCIGAQVSGEIKPFKAGDTYEYTEGHPALTDKSHPDYGKAKLGGYGTAENDGVWVDQFLSIPQSMLERQVEANANVLADRFAVMFGLAPQQTQQTTIDVYEEPAEEEVISQEAIGSKKETK